MDADGPVGPRLGVAASMCNTEAAETRNEAFTDTNSSLSILTVCICSFQFFVYICSSIIINM